MYVTDFFTQPLLLHYCLALPHPYFEASFYDITSFMIFDLKLCAQSQLCLPHGTVACPGGTCYAKKHGELIHTHSKICAFFDEPAITKKKKQLVPATSKKPTFCPRRATLSCAFLDFSSWRMRNTSSSAGKMNGLRPREFEHAEASSCRQCAAP